MSLKFGKTIRTLRLSQNYLVLIKKVYMRLKQVVCILVSIYFNTLTFAYNKNKLRETLDYWSRDMFNFHFLEKGLKIVFPPHSVVLFSFCVCFVSHPVLLWLFFSFIYSDFLLLAKWCMLLIVVYVNSNWT